MAFNSYFVRSLCVHFIFIHSVCTEKMVKLLFSVTVCQVAVIQNVQLSKREYKIEAILNPDLVNSVHEKLSEN